MFARDQPGDRTVRWVQNNVADETSSTFMGWPSAAAG